MKRCPLQHHGERPAGKATRLHVLEGLAQHLGHLLKKPLENGLCEWGSTAQRNGLGWRIPTESWGLR